MASSTSFRSSCENPAPQQKRSNITHARTHAPNRHTDTQTHRHKQTQTGLSGNNVVRCKVQRGKAALQHVGCSFGNEPFASSAHCVAWGAGENNKSSDSNKTAFACDFQSKAKSTLSAGAHTDIRTHDGMATRIAFASPKHKPLLGLLEVAGREEGHIHVACSLA